MQAVDVPKKLKPDECARCWKTKALCFCEGLNALRNQKPVALLQHPQECLKPLSTARLVSLSLENGVHRVGLSWRSLGTVLKREQGTGNWAVLYLGPSNKAKAWDGEPFRVTTPKEQAFPISKIEGILVLDGNWKQAKTLWWRNPWIARLNRLELNPELPSNYGSLRRGPRKAALSTIEATALALSVLGENQEISDSLNERFTLLLKRVLSTLPPQSA